MTTHTIEIKSRDALHHQVLVDGIYVSTQASLLHLGMQAGRAPTVTLGLNVPGGVGIELVGAGVVLAPDGAAVDQPRMVAAGRPGVIFGPAAADPA